MKIIPNFQCHLWLLDRTLHLYAIYQYIGHSKPHISTTSDPCWEFLSLEVMFLTCLPIEYGHRCTVESKHTTANGLEPLHVQYVITLGVLQQNDTLWEKHEWRRVNMALREQHVLRAETHSITWVPLITEVHQCLLTNASAHNSALVIESELQRWRTLLLVLERDSDIDVSAGRGGQRRSGPSHDS